MKASVLFAAIVMAVGLSVAPAGALSIVNGGFDGDLSGWTTTGAVSVVGGRAVVAENATGSLSSLEQTFVIPAGALDLRFTYEMTATPDGSSGWPFADAFAASLLDPSTKAPILSTPGFSDYFYQDNQGLTDYDPAIVSVAGDVVRLDLRSVAGGTDAMLAFDLLGGDDGQATTVAVDNVGIGVIPEPVTAATGLVTLLGVGAYLRRRVGHPRSSQGRT